MKKIKKIKIKINGKIKSITQDSKLSVVLKNLKIPLNKVAIELNEEIIDKKKISKIKLNKNDKIEIVHLLEVVKFEKRYTYNFKEKIQFKINCWHWQI